MEDSFKPLRVLAGRQVEALRSSPAGGQSSSLSCVDAEKKREVAVERAALLLGSFRKSEADEPEIFSRALEHVLSKYDIVIQIDVTEPGMWKYPPSAFELREACEKIANKMARDRLVEDQIRDQLAARRERQ